MNFSLHQVLHIKAAADDAKQTAEKAASAKLNEEALSKYEAQLKSVVTSLESGRVPKDSDIDRLFQSRLPLNEALDVKKQKRPPMKDMQKAVSSVEEVLFESQKKALYDYNPCLIPPKNLKDPVRVGQAKDNEQVIKGLEAMRKIPDSKFDRSRVIEDTLKRTDFVRGNLIEEELDEMRQELGKIVDKVRSLSPEEFEMEKSDIADQFRTVVDHKEKLKEALKQIEGEKSHIKGKIANFLLDSRIIAILEVRAQQLREQNVGKPVDLDSISPAASCKRQGGCAIKEK